MSDRATPLHLLARLAADSGHDLCLACHLHGRQQAGTLSTPARDTGDLAVEAAAACELLATELTIGASLIAQGSRRTGLLRSLVATRVALHLLPEVFRDGDGRFALALDDDGAPPAEPQLPGSALDDGATRLRAHLQQDDHGDWVDPHVVAGDVADVHDHIVRTLLWHELFGTDPVDPDGSCPDCDVDQDEW